MGLRLGDENRRRLPFGPVLAAAMLVAAASGLVELAGEIGRLTLRFDRAGLGQGELWRLLTAHLVHLGWSHYWLNIAALLLLGLLFGPLFPLAGWGLVTLASMFTIDAGLWLFEPSLDWYVGLSGVLHGFLAAAAVGLFRVRPAEAWLVTTLLLAKLLYESIVGPLPGSETASGGAVVVAAHFYGAVGGATAAVLHRVRVRPARTI